MGNIYFLKGNEIIANLFLNKANNNDLSDIIDELPVVVKKRINTELEKINIRNSEKVFDPNDLSPIKLHLGCGLRKIPSWINIDMSDSDYNMDLGNEEMPFVDSSVEAVVAQHVIEHLFLEDEFPFFLSQLNRIIKSNGIIWLSFPDLKKMCHAYVEDKGTNLLKNRIIRFPNFSMNDFPSQQIINDIFYQNGEHVMMYDFELISFILNKHGFTNINESCEREFLNNFPEFPKRNDDDVSLYINFQKKI